MRQCRVNRGILYVAGLLILALGLTLNTKTGLGTSPINGCENLFVLHPVSVCF